MARVTIEDCLENVGNMYELVHVATRRARQLYKGSHPLVKSKNRVLVTALREIAAAKVLPRFRDPRPSGSDDELDLLAH